MNSRLTLALIALFAVSAVAQDGGADKDKLSYAIGYQIGSDFKVRDLEVNIETVLTAIRDAVEDNEPTVAKEEMVALLKAMQEEIRTEQLEKFKVLAEENKVKSEEFLADNKNKKGIVVLPSGVQYRVIEDGDGSRPSTTSEVAVHYRSSTMAGLEYDSSFVRGAPVTLKVDQVLRGWQEVLPLMKAGAKWQIFVPPELAYGVRGQPPVGPNEAVVFDLNLVEIKS